MAAKRKHCSDCGQTHMCDPGRKGWQLSSGTTGFVVVLVVLFVFAVAWRLGVVK